MILFKINSAGFDTAIQRLKNQAQNRKPLMQKIAGIMHDEVEENFENEGRPKWVDLAPSTKRARARESKWPGKILQVSGQLVGSITPYSTNNVALVGTNKVYAPAMQYGNSKKKVPARPFLTIQERTMDEIRDEILHYLLVGE